MLILFYFVVVEGSGTRTLHQREEVTFLYLTSGTSSAKIKPRSQDVLISTISKKLAW